MTRDEALRLLGLADFCNAEAVRDAYEQRRGELELRRNATTPAALAAWVEQAKRLVSAREVLLAATTTSSLSATQLKDLPLSAPKNTAVSPAPALSATQVRDLPLLTPRHTTTAASTPWVAAANRDTPAAPASGPSVKLAAGTVLANRYEIRRLLGEGGMGIVYAVHDRTRGEEIALKVLQPHLLGDATAGKRFSDEAKIASGLSHANIVRVYDLHHDGAHTFLTMELLKGRSLREEILRRGQVSQRFTVEEVRGIGAQLCAALQEAHKQTVHRDVKPENIWLCEDGAVKLMDFGIARLMRPSQFTSTGLALGTAYYMAPEQLKGSKDLDHRADQYALGVVLYELLTGQIPIGAVRPPHQLRKNVPAELSEAIMKALAGDPAERHADMAVLANALSSHGRTSTRSRWLVVTAALALLLGAAATYPSWRTQFSHPAPDSVKVAPKVQEKAAAVDDGRKAAEVKARIEELLTKSEAALAKKDFGVAAKLFQQVLAMRFAAGQEQGLDSGESPLRALFIRAYRGAAIAAYGLHEYDRAIDLCNEALVMDADAVAVLGLRADAYLQKGALDEACASYDQAIRVDGKYVPAHRGRGQIYLRRKEYDKAIEEFTTVLKTENRDEAIYLQRASAYEAKVQQSAIDLNRAGALPQAVVAHKNAIQDYSSAIKLNAGNAVLYMKRAALCAKGGPFGFDFKGALKDYAEAIRLDPDNADYYLKRGQLYEGEYNRESMAKANADLTAAIRRKPKFAQAYVARAKVNTNLARMSDPDKYPEKAIPSFTQSIDDYTEASRLDPSLVDKSQFAQAYVSRGVAYGDLRNFGSGISDLEDAIRLEPGRQGIMKYLIEDYKQGRNGKR